MVFTSNFHDTKPLHPLKRSQKIRLRKEEEKRKRKNDKVCKKVTYNAQSIFNW